MKKSTRIVFGLLSAGVVAGLTAPVALADKTVTNLTIQWDHSAATANQSADHSDDATQLQYNGTGTYGYTNSSGHFVASATNDSQTQNANDASGTKVHGFQWLHDDTNASQTASGSVGVNQLQDNENADNQSQSSQTSAGSGDTNMSVRQYQGVRNVSSATQAAYASAGPTQVQSSGNWVVQSQYNGDSSDLVGSAKGKQAQWTDTAAHSTQTVSGSAGVNQHQQNVDATVQRQSQDASAVSGDTNQYQHQHARNSSTANQQAVNSLGAKQTQMAGNTVTQSASSSSAMPDSSSSTESVKQAQWANVKDSSNQVALSSIGVTQQQYTGNEVTQTETVGSSVSSDVGQHQHANVTSTSTQSAIHSPGASQTQYNGSTVTQTSNVTGTQYTTP